MQLDSCEVAGWRACIIITSDSVVSGRDARPVLLQLVRLVINYNPGISYVLQSVFWDLIFWDKKYSVRPFDVSYSLSKAANFIG